jgi:hypothetical protein
MRTTEKPVLGAVHVSLTQEISVAQINKWFQEKGIPVKLYPKKVNGEKHKMSDPEDLNDFSEENESDDEVQENKTTRKTPSVHGMYLKADENGLLLACLNASKLVDFALDGKDVKEYMKFIPIEDLSFQIMIEKRITLFASQYDQHKNREGFFVLVEEANDNSQNVVEILFLEILKDLYFVDRLERYKYLIDFHAKRLLLFIFIANYNLPKWNEIEKIWYFQLSNNKKQHKSPIRNKVSKVVLNTWYDIFKGFEKLEEKYLFAILDLLIQDWIIIDSYLYPENKSLYTHFFGTILIPFLKKMGSLNKFKTSIFELVNKKQNEDIDNKTQRGNQEKQLKDVVLFPHIVNIIEIILSVSQPKSPFESEIKKIFFQYFELDGNFKTEEVEKKKKNSKKKKL